MKYDEPVRTFELGPRRPDPELGFRERLAERRQSLRDRLSMSRDDSWFDDDAGSRSELNLSGEPTGSEAPGSVLVHLLVAVGSAALALGCLFGWQAWSQRSAEPVDDQLPLLAELGLPVADDDVEVTTPVASGSAAGLDRDPAGVPGDLGPAAQVSGAENSGAPVSGAGNAEASTELPTVGRTVTPASEPASEPETTPTPVVDIVVHVTGAVVAPGVVHLAPGSRAFEAVELAGGAAETADLDRVNLAAALVDGERLHVPSVGEDSAPALVEPDRPAPTLIPAPPQGAPPAEPTPIVVDLNRGSAVELQTLPGVGPATAEAIVRTREERGPYWVIEDLLEVPGIGNTRLEQLRPYVQIQDVRTG